jgi:NTE family protein
MNYCRLFGWSALGLLLICITGCTNANRPLNDPHVRLEARQSNHTRAAMIAAGRSAPGHPSATSHDGFFVGLSISGGGSRSANFAAACMFQLERLGLLQKVDYISSVSGGSLTAAYYCLNGSEWNPGNVQKKLTQSFATELFAQGWMPWNWVAVAFTDYDRSDLLAHIFQDKLYTHNGHALTFADLRPDRPRLLINSTDLQTGRRFVFTNESFDDMNSDLAKYPISYAVAASSAVPVILHPVTLRDYSTSFPQYRHLIDGGITDNLGIETLVDAYAGERAEAARNQLPDPYPNGAVFVVIDAHTKFDAELSNESDIGALENLKVAFGLTSSSLVASVDEANMSDVILRNASADRTAGQLREDMKQLTRTGYLDVKEKSGRSIRVIYLSLTQVNTLHNLPFSNFSESINSISTYFNITDREAYHLYEAAELLMKDKFEDKVKTIVEDLNHGATTRPAR